MACVMHEGGCPAPQGLVRREYASRAYFKTLNRLVVWGAFADPDEVARADACWTRLEALLARLQALFDPNEPASQVAAYARLATGESMAADPLTARLLEASRRAWVLTEGRFDPTAGPLVDLWGLSPRSWRASGKAAPWDRPWDGGAPGLPAPEDLAAASSLVGLPGVGLLGDAERGWTLQKRTRSARMGGVRVEAQLDLGGIAKGFAADVARRIVADAGFEFGYYSSESSICLLGCASGEAVRRRARDHNVYLTDPWANPRRPVPYLMTRASGCTVSTSGSYVRSYACDGVTFSHVVNPRTGLPAAVGRDGRGGYEQLPGVVTASVIGPDATMGDALATALCMMEPREAVAFYNERLRNEWHVVLVTSEGQGAGGARQRILTSLPREDYYLYGRRYPVASRVDHGRIAVVDED